jgi:hypothetical protein
MTETDAGTWGVGIGELGDLEALGCSMEVVLPLAAEATKPSVDRLTDENS